MKYCGNCGNQLVDDARFCGKCGHTVPGAEPAAGVESGAAGYPPVQMDYPPPPFQPAYDYDTGQGAMPPDNAAVLNAPPPKRRLWIYLLSGAAVLLAVLGAVFYYLGNFSEPRTTRLAPANTELFIYAKPDLFQVRNFTTVRDTYMSIPEVKTAYDKFLQMQRDNLNFDFEQDVKPWLGKEAAYFMPSVSKPESMIFVAEQKDKNKAREYINKLAAKEKTHEETYQGVTITANDSHFAAAISGDFLMIATDKNLLKQTIDREKGTTKDSIRDNKDFQGIIKNLPGGESVYCYANLSSAINEAFDVNVRNQQVPDQLKNFKQMGLGIGFESNGIRGDYVVACDKDNVPTYLKKKTTGSADLKDTLSLIPAECLGFVRSDMVVAFFQEMYNNPSDKNTRDFKKEAQKFEQQTGINLQRDIFDVCRGDVTAVAMPNRDLNMLGIGHVFAGVSGGALIVGIKEQQQAGSTLDKFSQFAQKERVNVNKSSSNGFQIYEYRQANNNRYLFSLGLGKNDAVLSSSAEVLGSITGKHASLADDARYKKAFEPFASDAQPVLFVNIKNISTLVENNLSDREKTEYRETVYPWTIPLQSVSAAASGYNSSKGTLEGGLFICIQK
ncbi:MAG: DUF3352 domain-containing protein [Syntrophomonadaceae bacterium]